MRSEIAKRIGPFVALLDARYLPLLFAVAPQAYAVYDWLVKSHAPENVAIMGGLGFEMVYVGAIAWAEDGRSSFWTWATAVVSLIFSIGVAVYTYSDQGVAAWLHGGFPLVAFCYTLQMHAATKVQPVKQQIAQPASIEVDNVPQVPQPQQIAGNILHLLEDVEPQPPAPLRGGRLPDATILQAKVAELGSKQAAAAFYGVSRQAVDNKLRNAA